MLGDIDRRAAIFAAQGQSLKDAQADHDDGCGDADAGCAGDQADPGGRNAHQRHCDEKGVFAPQAVAEISEQDRTQGPEPETDCEARPNEQQLERLVIAREKGRADQGGERAVDEEIVPFEDGPRAAGGDDEADLLLGGLALDGRR